MTWKTTLQEAFTQNANKVVSDKEYETLFEIQAGNSREKQEKIALENIDNTVPVEIAHADYQAKIDALFSSVGDGSMGVYASDQTAKLYSHVSYIEFFQNYGDTLSILPENIAEKLATAVACALKHSKDYSADVKSGALKPLAPGAC